MQRSSRTVPMLFQSVRWDAMRCKADEGGGEAANIVSASGGRSTCKSLINGSPGRIRTSDQPVNSRLLYR